MAESVIPEQEFLLDTSRIEGEVDQHDIGGVINDHERTFVPAGGIKPEDLAQALRIEHPESKYPGFSVIFEVVKERVVVSITPKV